MARMTAKPRVSKDDHQGLEELIHVDKSDVDKRECHTCPYHREFIWRHSKPCFGSQRGVKIIYTNTKSESYKDALKSHRCNGSILPSDYNDTRVLKRLHDMSKTDNSWLLDNIIRDH
jgi:hypothetical protein